MKLENKNTKRTLLALWSILLLSVVFIATSIVLIDKVNTSQKFLKYKVNAITVATQVETNAGLLMKQLNTKSELDKRLLEESIALTKGYKDLKIITLILNEINSTTSKPLNFIQKTKTQEDLVVVEELSNELVIEIRKEIRDESIKLSEYWKYTFIVLIVACCLMLLLAVSALYVNKTKKSLQKEKSKNRFLFENSNNFIVSCDEKGNLVEFNPAAEKQFGYHQNEVVSLNYEELYSSKEQAKVVSNALEKDGVFSGEVVNKKKDGTLFVSHLSANVIYNEEGSVVGSMGISRDVTKEKETEKEFKSIINKAQDIIYTVNPEGKFTFVNGIGSNIMGYGDKELLGKYFIELVHPEEVDRVRKFYKTQFRKKIPTSYMEFKGIAKDKRAIWLGQNITCLFSPTDPEEIIGFQGIVRNISKRKDAEIKLKKSEESFRIIVNTINDLFYLFDFRTDQFEYISPNTEQVLGVPRDFFYSGKSFFQEYVHSEDVAEAMKAEAQLLRGEPYNIEYRLVSNGRTRWIHDRAFPIKNQQGRVISYSGVSRDITDAKRQELIIEQQNEEISQSISYAKNIQDSVLLTTKEMYGLYPDCFVFFNPRDSLSGDFYMVDKFETDQFGTLTAFVVADCTGHGVPGGMLSFLCNSLVREAFSNVSINSPSEVLDFVRKKLAELFRSSDESHIYDGMDISLCAMSENKETLYFSGANLPITVIRDGEAMEIKGDRQHVGYSRKNQEFTTQIIDIKKGDMLFLCSDGYQDQFGGPHGKKYMKRRLRDLLTDVHDKPLEEQYNLIKLEFHQWKADRNQVDDVCLMGIRV